MALVESAKLWTWYVTGFCVHSADTGSLDSGRWAVPGFWIVPISPIKDVERSRILNINHHGCFRIPHYQCQPAQSLNSPFTSFQILNDFTSMFLRARCLWKWCTVLKYTSTNDCLFFQALVGCNVQIPTLEGRKLSLHITDIIKPNTVKRIQSKGLPNPKDASKRGDLVVNFDIRFPDSLPQATKDILGDCLPRGTGAATWELSQLN